MYKLSCVSKLLSSFEWFSYDLVWIYESYSGAKNVDLMGFVREGYD